MLMRAKRKFQYIRNSRETIRISVVAIAALKLVCCTETENYEYVYETSDFRCPKGAMDSPSVLSSFSFDLLKIFLENASPLIFNNANIRLNKFLCPNLVPPCDLPPNLDFFFFRLLIGTCLPSLSPVFEKIFRCLSHIAFNFKVLFFPEL